MNTCAKDCILKKSECDKKECRMWINYKEDLNCTFVAVEKNGKMSLREVADRIGVSFVRIKQIQDKAIKKLLKPLDISTLKD